MTKDTLVCLIIGIAIGWFAHSYFTKPETITETINLTEFEIAQIRQEAVLGWYSADSVKKLISLAQKTKINWIDSIRIVKRDSLNLKDSIVYIGQSIPVYEADSLIVKEGKDSSGNKAVISIALRQRFLPLHEAFATDVEIQSLKFHLNTPVKKWYDNFCLTAGAGIVGTSEKVSFGVFAGVGYIIKF